MTARAAIYLRIRRAEQGNFGEYKVLDDGVSEMKINVGQGYRVYFAREGRVTYLLLCGGESQRKRPISNARKPCGKRSRTRHEQNQDFTF
ncbi:MULTISPECIES: type II toxin-antitoxin system RelE/ParE family toxin [Burkholderiaceae]|uniref:type II toxin-antitoxin system RelE/ParE family toxin n=1 Tax=Burkholderiaceae TaxID=119060 RepID=UPI001F3AAAEC|nr:MULTISPECIES: type II toxin-antitoxin system RelE/ParE family toxin [Burkholderiaceae]